MSTNSTTQLEQRVSGDEAIIDSAASDLGDLPALIKLLNEQLHSITVETERSAYSIMERLQAIDGATNELISALSASLKEPGDMRERDEKMRAHLDDASATLSSMFMEVLAGIQFQDVTRQQIEQVQNALNRLDAHVAQMVVMMRSKDFSEAASIKEHIDQIYDSYVMAKQRDVHASAIGDHIESGADSASAPKIELF